MYMCTLFNPQSMTVSDYEYEISFIHHFYLDFYLLPTEIMLLSMYQKTHINVVPSTSVVWGKLWATSNYGGIS